MARKRSASGRSRGVSAVQRLFIQAEKINKRIKALEKADLYGTYKSRELQQFAKETAGVRISTSRSGKHKISVSSNLRPQQIRLITKKFGEFLSSPYSTPVGIKKARASMRKKLTQTLSEQLGKKVSDKDVDKFLDIAKYAERVRQASILEYIDPSEFMAIVSYAKDKSMEQDAWVSLLNQYVTINNQTMREEAQYLYEKYVA